jgi:hypothetical protein
MWAGKPGGLKAVLEVCLTGFFADPLRVLCGQKTKNQSFIRIHINVMYKSCFRLSLIARVKDEASINFPFAGISE